MPGLKSDFDFLRGANSADMSSYFLMNEDGPNDYTGSMRGANSKDSLYTWIRNDGISITSEGKLEVLVNAGDLFGSNEMIHGVGFGLVAGSIIGLQGGIIATIDGHGGQFVLGYFADGTKTLSFHETGSVSLSQYAWYRVYLYFLKNGSTWEVEARLYDNTDTRLSTLIHDFSTTNVGSYPGIFEMTDGQYSYCDNFKVFDYS